MKQWKVARRVLVVLAVTAAFAACGDDDDESDASVDSDATEDTTEQEEELNGTLSIVGSVSRTGPGTFLAIAVEQFEAEHPGVDVTLEGAELSALSQTLPPQINAGQAPDIISTLTGYGLPIAALELGGNDLLVDLTGEEWVERLDDTIRSQIAVDGAIYSLPTDSLTVAVHYDPAVFDANGLEVPGTYDELLDLCRRAVDEGTIAMSLSAGEPYLHQTFTMLGILGTEVEPDHTEQLLAGRTTFAESDGWRRSLEKLQEMTQTGCFGENPLAVTRDSAEERFATGGAYMMGSYSLGQARIEPLNPEANFGLFPFPADEAGEGRVPQGAVVGLAIPKSGDNVELATAFVNFVAENAERIAAETGGLTVPVVVDDPDNPPPLPDYMTDIQPLVDAGQITIDYTGTWPYVDAVTAYNEGVASVIQGSAEPDEVLAALDRAWEASR